MSTARLRRLPRARPAGGTGTGAAVGELSWLTVATPMDNP